MLVGTEGSSSEVTAITLLAGVEPILQGSPNGASSILSPWSLSGAPGGGSGHTVAHPGEAARRLSKINSENG